MRRMALLVPLFFLAALFFGWKTYEAWTAPPEAALRAPAPVAGPGPVAAVETEQDIPGTLAAIVARPLFRPDRRPYPYQENAAAAPRRNYESELSGFTVIGVLLVEEIGMAVVTGKTGGRYERYEVGPGDALPGFTVKEIQSDGILVAADGKEFTLPLYTGAPKAPPGGTLRTEVATPARPGAGGPSPVPPSPGVGAPAPSRRAPSPTAERPRPLPVPPVSKPVPSTRAGLPDYPIPTSATYAPEGGSPSVLRRTPERR